MRYFAPGLPKKNVTSEIPAIAERRPVEFVVQDHRALKSGPHFDLRLAINGIGFSWAGKQWPGPGEKVLFNSVFDHCLLPGTKIDGIPIEEAVKKKIKKISSLDGVEIITAPVDGWSKSKKEKRDVIKLSYHNFNGRRQNLYCTEGHKIYTTDGIKIAANLQVGDNLLVKGYILPEELKQVIYGSLLGDGGVSSNGNYEEVHSYKQSKYLKYKIGLFEDIATISVGKQGSGGYSQEGTPTVRGYISPILFFRELRKELYETGKKKLTHEFINNLDPIALAYWYMDDGDRKSVV